MLLTPLPLTDLAEKGRALGRTSDGRVVFVKGGAPGDTVSAEIIKDHGSYIEARLVEVLDPSPERVAPFCEHFGLCGGCSWQHISYAGQLSGKQRVVEAALQRIGHVELPEEGVRPILPSPLERRYRNKLEFTFTQRRWLDDRDAAERALIGDTAADKRGLGFHLPGRYDSVFSVRECHLQPEPSNAIRLAVLARARELGLPFFNLRARRPGEGGYLRTFTLRNTQDGAWMALLLVSEDRPADLEALLGPLVVQFPQVESWMYAISAKGNQTLHGIPVRCFAGVPTLQEKLEHLSFELSAASFFQPNPLQAVHLYRAALAMAGLTGTERVYDLYCGTGTISLLAAAHTAEVIGIEYVPTAVADARANAARNGITNARFFAGDMAALLTQDFISQEGAPDVVIVDPPRAGMAADVVTRLAEAAPARIVYVSCNPATQARDLAMLAHRYQITAVQPVDMFPHTDHVENVASLTLKT